MLPVTRYFALLLSAVAISNTNAGAPSCRSTLGGTYDGAVSAYPNLKDKIELVAKQSIAQWYTDRIADTASLAASVVLPVCDSTSQATSLPTVVIYGLPQKDCAHGFSSSGSNTDASTYRAFLQQLVDAAGSQQVVYILEPDAIGLLADEGCGTKNGYADNLGVALEVLSQNPNAEIYLDVGYWTLSSDEQAAAVAKIVTSVDPNCKSKGISLNTSNYRSNAEMEASCERFVRASGKDYKCIVDTSRNLVTPASNEWCNAKWAGIGELPTTNTGLNYVSRFVWVKRPGESDGECTGQSSDALQGPSAGSFFPDHFVQLWDSGVFVQKLGMDTINAAANTSSNSTAQASSTTAPITESPSTTALTSQTTTTATVQLDADIGFSTLSALDVDAGDSWPDDNAGVKAADAISTTTAPPIQIVEVTQAPPAVVIDVDPTEYTVDDAGVTTDYTTVKYDTTVDSTASIRKHKACE